MTRQEITDLYMECIEEVASHGAKHPNGMSSWDYDTYSLGWYEACAEKFVGLTPGRALDIGCLFGTSAVFLSRLGWSVTGFDVHPYVSEEIREKYRLPVICADLEDEKGREELHRGYDLILFSEVLEHLNFNPYGPMDWIWHRLYDWGTLVLSTPDGDHYPGLPPDSPTQRHCHWEEIPDFDPAAPRRFDGHSKQYSISELGNLLTETGFKVNSLEQFGWQGMHLLAVAGRAK